MGFIPDEIINQVIDRNDIVDVISSYVPLKKAGRNFKALSPFKNEKTPSFVVSPDKQIFHCFSSGEGGNVISFVMKMERVEFPEAVRILARRVNIEIPQDRSEQTRSGFKKQDFCSLNKTAAEFYHKELLSGQSKEAENARQYLKQRGISLDTVKKFQLGYAPAQWDSLIKHFASRNVKPELLLKAGLVIARENSQGHYDRFRNRVMFPIFDLRGECFAFGARALDDSPAKYINSPETEVYTKGKHLYGFHLSKDPVVREDCIVLVEGYMDCVMPVQAGFENIAASLGTALTSEQIRLVRRYTRNVVMLYDADPAGEAAMLRSLDLLIEEGMHVRIARLDEGDDPDTFIRKKGLEEFKQQILSAQSVFDYKLDKLSEKYDRFSIAGKSEIASDMLATLDKIPNELERSEFLRKLAGELRVKEEDLKAQWEKDKKTGVQRYLKDLDERTKQSEKVANGIERGILKLLMEEKDLISATKNEVELNDFEDHKVRDVLSKMFDFFEQGKDTSPQKLLNTFDDAGIQQMITELMMDETFLISNKEKMHSDYITRMRVKRIKDLRKKLLEEIQQAEANGDHVRLEELKKDFNQLVKQ